jgi:hypothetical protein
MVIINRQPYYVVIQASFVTKHGKYGKVAGHSSVRFNSKEVKKAFNDAMYNAVYTARARANDSIVSITANSSKVVNIYSYKGTKFSRRETKVQYKGGRKETRYYLQVDDRGFKRVKNKQVNKGITTKERKELNFEFESDVSNVRKSKMRYKA